MVINSHMVMIQVQVGKNTIEDVLLHKSSIINIIMEQLRTQLSLPNQNIHHTIYR
jgi:hypothetical protein